MNEERLAALIGRAWQMADALRGLLDEAHLVFEGKALCGWCKEIVSEDDIFEVHTYPHGVKTEACGQCREKMRESRG